MRRSCIVICNDIVQLISVKSQTWDNTEGRFCKFHRGIIFLKFVHDGSGISQVKSSKRKCAHTAYFRLDSSMKLIKLPVETKR